MLVSSPENVRACVIIFFIELKIQQSPLFKLSTKHSQVFSCNVDCIHSFRRHVTSLDIIITNNCSIKKNVREKILFEKKLNIFSLLELLLDR